MEFSLENGTLTVVWSTTQAFKKALPALREGTLVVPQRLEGIERLSLVLPNQTRLALRVKELNTTENTTKLSFRINPVLDSKLDTALE